MLRQIITLVALSSVSLALHAQDSGPSKEVCAIRPDLCDKPRIRRGPAQLTPSTRGRGTSIAAPTAAPEPVAPATRQAPPAPRAQTKRCRSAADFSLAESELPICQVDALAAAEAARAKRVTARPVAREMPTAAPREIVQQAPVRELASTFTPVRSLSFDEYMNANATHPAMRGKIMDHQRAFVDTAKAAIISYPNEGNAGPNENPSVPASQLPSASTTTTSSPPPAPSLWPSTSGNGSVPMPSSTTTAPAATGSSAPAGPIR
jgi:translation initiation factor IF-2